jgi:hypothetical protein
MRIKLTGVLGAVLTMGCAIANQMSGMSLVDELRDRGVSAEARILEIWDTHMRVNDDPVVGFLLEVRPPDRAPYQAKAKGLISIIFIPQFQPGAIVPVRFDPDDPSRVALDVYER